MALSPKQFASITEKVTAEAGPQATLGDNGWEKHYSTVHTPPADADEMLKRSKDVRLDKKV